MNTILTYKDLFNQIETLNSSAYTFLLNNDFNSFTSLIEDFINSGIMEQERFSNARRAYRLVSMPFTLNGFYIGTEDNNNFLNNITNGISGWNIEDLKQRDIYPLYAYLTQDEKIERAKNKLHDKRIDALNHYIELYQNLYKVPQTVSVFGIPYVADIEQHQKLYIDKIVELADARSKFHLTFNFNCSSIDNELLAKQTIPEKMNYLTQNFSSIFKTQNIADFFSFGNDDTKILMSNYIHGKGIDRKNWKNYKKGIFCNIPLFYLEMAFYLSIPSSTEIEKFMNLHGYSISSPMTHFHDIYYGKNVYHILYRDLQRWVDAGIDYNLINSLCGMQLEIKEKKK